MVLINCEQMNSQVIAVVLCVFGPHYKMSLYSVAYELWSDR